MWRLHVQGAGISQQLKESRSQEGEEGNSCAGQTGMRSLDVVNVLKDHGRFMSRAVLSLLVL